MTNRKIIENTIALNQSHLSKEEQEEVYNLLVTYRGEFILRDKIGIFCNIEVNLQVYGKFTFSLDLFMSIKKTN